MYKILIWGMGQEYSDHINLIKMYEKIGEIDIVGITGNETIYKYVDGIEFCPKNRLSNKGFDYCLVCVKDFDEIISEADRYGIARDNLIPARVLNIPGFNFKKYCWLKKK